MSTYVKQPLDLLTHYAQVQSNERTARQAVDESLAVIRANESTLKVWQHLDADDVRLQADRLDADRARGRPAGPLFGVPIGIKDLFDVAGIPTGCGSRRLQSGVAPHVDCPLVSRLRRAGAIILGKTVTTQFACFDPPATRNPWNLERTPGGSSSGSAAGVASGMFPAALGSQTGGSIIRPASFCGIAGFKPSYQRLPIAGVYPAAPSLDHPGPMAGSAADLRLLMAVLSSEDFRGLRSSDFEWTRRLKTWSSRSLNGPRLRIGRLGRFFADRAAADCWQVFERTATLLEDAGHILSDCPLPKAFDEVLIYHRAIMVAEIAEHHLPQYAKYPEDYLPGMRSLLDEGQQVTAIKYLDAKSRQRCLSVDVDDCFREFDLLISPSTIGGAPGPETTGDPSFNAPFSFLGLPVTTLPMGVDRDGMPLGLQLIGPRNRDVDLLDWSVQIEATLKRI